MHGVLKLRKMVQDDPDMGWRDRYDARGTEEIVAGTGGTQLAASSSESTGAGQDPVPATPQGMTDPPQDSDA
jgi:hypothetical protein